MKTLLLILFTKFKIIMNVIIALYPILVGLEDCIQKCRYYWDSFCLEMRDMYFEKKQLEFSVTTDKTTYSIGEPVILDISLINRSNREIEIGYSKSFFHGVSIFILPPGEKEWIKLDYQSLIESIYNSGLPKSHGTRLWNALSIWSGFRSWTIHPNKRLINKIPLSRIFDMTSPKGKYSIRVSFPLYKSGFRFHTTSKFADYDKDISIWIKDPSLSSADITAEAFVRMIGKKKAFDLLFPEAEELLSTMEKETGEKLEKSKEYPRLLMLMRTMSGVAELGGDENFTRFEEENRLSPEDFRRFIQRCREKVEAAEQPNGKK